MPSSAQIRHRGARDFGGFYEHACAAQGSAPLPAVKANLGRGVLDFNGDVVSLPDWTPVLSALTINTHLQQVAIRSCYLSSLGSQALCKAPSRKKTPVIQSKNVTFQLCRALQKCMCVSPSLKTLQIHGVPLREQDLHLLTKGLAKSVSLEHLSLARCPIADVGLEALCQSVKYSTTIRTVDFTSCNITWRGAEHMANIIKHQAMKRHSTAWAESLRYRKAEFEAMGGLRRITLNDNILIGDRGVMALAQELTEDLWVKAVDLQRCGISNEGAGVLEKMVQSNSTLCVLDIRRNPLVDNELVKAVIMKVLANTKGQDAQYLWLKPPAKEPRDSGHVTRRGAGRASRRSEGSRRAAACGRRPPRPGPSSCIPWRTAARAQRQRGLPQGDATANQSFQNASSVRVTMETESEPECEDVGSSHTSGGNIRRLQADYKRLQMELEECRRCLAEERTARLKANSHVVELESEIRRLRSLNQSLSEAHITHSVLEDDSVLESIESSFHKFHAFLDLLRDAGLGQLVSMAGIKQTDFGLLGRPRLSSTGRGGRGDEGSVWKERHTTITDVTQRASEFQHIRSGSSEDSPHSQRPQETSLRPERRVASPDHRLGGASVSVRGGTSRGSKPGSSAGSTDAGTRNSLSGSYREDISEGNVTSAPSSRSSSASQVGPERCADVEAQRDVVGRAGL
ncbi:centrosomal protein of 78 kDa [Brachyhypopomus gauderio]|uniref:centrosomal protein of 78 kDa n=1 Tax=Brachyhypopomus gauderio TaxID=698409 RepID=UPI0040427E89